MQSMATSRKPRATENLNVWVRSDLVVQLRDFVDATRPRTTKTAVVEELIEIGLSMPVELLDALRASAATGWRDIERITRFCEDYVPEEAE